MMDFAHLIAFTLFKQDMEKLLTLASRSFIVHMRIQASGEQAKSVNFEKGHPVMLKYDVHICRTSS